MKQLLVSCLLSCQPSEVFFWRFYWVSIWIRPQEHNFDKYHGVPCVCLICPNGCKKCHQMSVSVIISKKTLLPGQPWFKCTMRSVGWILLPWVLVHFTNSLWGIWCLPLYLPILLGHFDCCHGYSYLIFFLLICSQAWAIRSNNTTSFERTTGWSE